MTEFLLEHFTRAESSERFAEALGIRTAVFTEEQRVPADHDVDATDDVACHWLVTPPESSVPVATGRMFPDPKIPGAARIGRMAVLASHRGRGIGEILLGAMLAEGERQGYREMICDAQTHALGYYRKRGFVAEGGEFLDENIPHFFMRHVYVKDAVQGASAG